MCDYSEGRGAARSARRERGDAAAPGAHAAGDAAARREAAAPPRGERACEHAHFASAAAVAGAGADGGRGGWEAQLSEEMLLSSARRRCAARTSREFDCSLIYARLSAVEFRVANVRTPAAPGKHQTVVGTCRASRATAAATCRLPGDVLECPC